MGIRSASRVAPVADPRPALQSTLADFARKNPSIRNCVLSVMSGDGSLVWSGGVGHAGANTPMTGDTPIYIASVTKLYTATAVMLLVEQGALSLDDPMAKYLPGKLIRGIDIYRGKDLTGEITIRELLAHRSGIPDYYSDKAQDGKTLFELFVDDPERRWTPDETIERARDELTPQFAPDAETSYSDTNYQLLGKVIETVTGKPLYMVYEDFFFRPQGLRHTWMTGHCRPQESSCLGPADVFLADRNITATRANGAYWADGGIISTAGDMNLFLKALNEGRIIRPPSLQRMHDWRRMSFPMEYGFGTMQFALPGPVRKVAGIPLLWGHSGSTGSFLYYCQDLDLYMAGTTDQVDGRIEPFLLMRRVMREVREAQRNQRSSSHGGISPS